ncbi:MAG: hypothetical protein WBP08_03600 [Saprospiraceae bacterium]
MKKYKRQILSTVVIVTFLIIAIASVPEIGPEPSENCNFRAEKSLVVHEINITVLDKETGIPISGADIELSTYTYQKFKNGEKCEFNVVDHKVEDGNSNPAKFNRTHTYVTDEDYIELHIYAVHREYGSKDDFQVLRIGTPVRNIIIKMLKPKTS